MESLHWLEQNTIIMALSGSRAYGTSTPASDVDLMGIAVPPIEYSMGFHKRFEQADKPTHLEKFRKYLTPELEATVNNSKMEGSIYELRKFFSLAADMNPNFIQLLYTDDSDIILLRPAGEILRKNRDLFLSRAARDRFMGYAMSQLHRIKSHREDFINPVSKPSREEFGLKPETSIPTDQLRAIQAQTQKQLDRWNEGSLGDLQESDKIRIRESIAQLLAELEITADTRFKAACRGVGFEENFIEYLAKERSYKNAVDKWNQYQAWKSDRNKDRAELEIKYGYDTKHALHLVRLMTMCKEILRDGRVLVKRPDAGMLLSIRHGEWSYEKLIDFAERSKAEVDDLMLKSPLPKYADKEKLDGLCIEIMGMYAKKT